MVIFIRDWELGLTLETMFEKLLSDIETWNPAVACLRHGDRISGWQEALLMKTQSKSTLQAVLSP